MGDPFLDYFALGLLLFVGGVLFYGIIAIHDIPARIAESRHYPHADAIHAAGWVSMFTLHVLWRKMNFCQLRMRNRILRDSERWYTATSADDPNGI